MLSSLAGPVSAARRHARRAAGRSRQRLRPDARAAGRPGRGQAALLLRATCAGSTCSRSTLPGAAAAGRSPARSTPASTPAPREIVDRAHWLPQQAAVPLRRASARSRRTSPARYRLSVDGVEREYAAANVVVANSAYYGKGMKIAPAAAVDDGVLDVVVIEAASRLDADARAAQGLRRRATSTCPRSPC